MVSLGRSDLDVFPICLGGNVFGWTADEPQTRAFLDAYTGAGGNFIDTSNSYLVERGRRSETIIGRLQTNRIDLYYAHFDVEETQLEGLGL
jgi:aryl-alcohol dehydrogenase-like predicted oxidoreductase